MSAAETSNVVSVNVEVILSPNIIRYIYMSYNLFSQLNISKYAYQYMFWCIWYLYISVTGDTEGKKVMRNGVKAAEMFCMIESLTQNTAPFTWLFIRPPWSLNGACCKECVFTYMKNYLKKVDYFYQTSLFLENTWKK